VVVSKKRGAQSIGSVRNREERLSSFPAGKGEHLRKQHRGEGKGVFGIWKSTEQNRGGHDSSERTLELARLEKELHRRKKRDLTRGRERGCSKA